MQKRGVLSYDTQTLIAAALILLMASLAPIHSAELAQNNGDTEFTPPLTGRAGSGGDPFSQFFKLIDVIRDQLLNGGIDKDLLHEIKDGMESEDLNTRYRHCVNIKTLLDKESKYLDWLLKHADQRIWAVGKARYDIILHVAKQIVDLLQFIFDLYCRNTIFNPDSYTPVPQITPDTVFGDYFEPGFGHERGVNLKPFTPSGGLEIYKPIPYWEQHPYGVPDKVIIFAFALSCGVLLCLGIIVAAGAATTSAVVAGVNSLAAAAEGGPIISLAAARMYLARNAAAGIAAIPTITAAQFHKDVEEILKNPDILKPYEDQLKREAEKVCPTTPKIDLNPGVIFSPATPKPTVDEAKAAKTCSDFTPTFTLKSHPYYLLLSLTGVPAATTFTISKMNDLDYNSFPTLTISNPSLKSHLGTDSTGVTGLIVDQGLLYGGEGFASLKTDQLCQELKKKGKREAEIEVIAHLPVPSNCPRQTRKYTIVVYCKDDGTYGRYDGPFETPPGGSSSTSGAGSPPPTGGGGTAGSGTGCDGDPTTPLCEPNNANCPANQYCDNACKCQPLPGACEWKEIKTGGTGDEPGDDSGGITKVCVDSCPPGTQCNDLCNQCIR